MRIKSLQITGFKSFVERTVLRFQPGITGIVGPNGCGKSNVVDAMRWAMGEQSPRRLRGKGMDDVIFAGSEVRAPVGMAEVVLTFDNANGDAPPTYAAFSEIQIARRLYRSGESEYLINKAPCRLRDVLDFFRDTGVGTRGYTIVEQGQIGAIVSAKPEERRALIEEAAGISKYKARRAEAERKIQSTEQNLARVSDVLGELRRQISSVERQARKAARFKRLREMQRTLDLSLASDDRRELRSELDGASERSARLQDEALAAEARLGQGELAHEQARFELAEREKVLSEGSEVLLGLRGEIKQLETSIQFEERERANLEDLRQAREAELGDLRQQLESGRSELARLAEEAEALERAVAAQDDQLAAAEAEARQTREALSGQERERETANAALVELLTRIARTEDRLASLDDRQAEVAQRLRTADEQLEVQQSEAVRASREQTSLEEGLRNLLSERDRLMGALRGALEREEGAKARLREAAQRLAGARERREMRRARLASLRELAERREDLLTGTRSLLDEGEAGRVRFGLRGLLREGLEVEPELEVAVEAVLEEHAEALVVERPEGALGALEALRRGESGRGLFVFETPGEPGSLGFVPLGEPLLDRVRARPGFEGVARALLGRVNLVDDLHQVLEVYGAGRIPATFVTSRGDVLLPEGIVRGGGGPAPGGLARARELRELGSEVDTLERETAAAEAAHRTAELEANQAEDELENLRNRHHTAALAVANHEKDLERTRERVKALFEVQEGRAAERSDLIASSESSAEDRQRLVVLLESLREEKLGSQRAIEQLGLRIGSASRELARCEAIVTERRVERAGRAETRDRLRAERERSSSAVAEGAQWIARREHEIAAAVERRAQLAESVQGAQTALAALLAREEAARATHDQKRDAFERQAGNVRELEESNRRLRTDATARREAVQQAQLTLRESELRLQHLEAAVRERWGVDLASWTPPTAEALAAQAAEPEDEVDSEAPADAAEDDAAESEAAELRVREAALDLLTLSGEDRRERLEEVRRKLEALGEVNLGALEEHEELHERFRFLSEQKADLESTLESLREAISRINRTSRKRFRETFEAVNERFQQNFPRLFRGGKASLTLAEADDVLEAGVDIMAMPPGKRLQNVNLLSGGEKTLTALSLLISLFQVRPSPFFLLDEVDAPLDDANVGRFNEIVREMSKESQFLLITHNKRTIEVADLLYGVTMEEKGVSTLVSVELH